MKKYPRVAIKRSLGFSQTEFCGNSLSLTVSFRCIKTGLGPFSPSCRCCFSSLAKATDICKSCRVQLHAPDSSLTHGNLAGGVQESHAGLPQKKPDYSLVSAHLLSKGKKKKTFSNSQTVLCIAQSDVIRSSTEESTRISLIFLLFEVSWWRTCGSVLDPGIWLSLQTQCPFVREEVWGNWDITWRLCASNSLVKSIKERSWAGFCGW